MDIEVGLTDPTIKQKIGQGQYIRRWTREIKSIEMLK